MPASNPDRDLAPYHPEAPGFNGEMLDAVVRAAYTEGVIKGREEVEALRAQIEGFGPRIHEKLDEITPLIELVSAQVEGSRMAGSVKRDCQKALARAIILISQIA